RQLRRTRTTRSDFGVDQALHSGRGLIIGRFDPPHRGHQYLIDFARQYCTDLAVQVTGEPKDSIPGETRAAWLTELFPRINVVWVDTALPMLSPQIAASQAQFR